MRLSGRAVRIEVDGELAAETTRARLLCETSLPMRFYVPREDLRAELEPSASTSHCPYKGDASWWSLAGHEDLAWSYEQPLPEVAAIAGHEAFWDERVEVFVDGERRARPDTLFSQILLEEFGV